MYVIIYVEELINTTKHAINFEKVRTLTLEMYFSKKSFKPR